MKCLLIVLLMLINSVGATAQISRPIGKTTPTRKTISTPTRKKYYEPPVQKNNLYADAATPISSGFPGFSATYSYMNTDYLGVGFGIQGYNFKDIQYNLHQFIPAVFGNLRLRCRPLKKNQFFFALDIGINIYKHNDSIYITPWGETYKASGNNGIYIGHGFGYFRRMTQKGGGPYVMLKMLSNIYNAQRYKKATGQWSEKSPNLDAISTVSVGFKF